MSDQFILTNLELRESTETGDVAEGLSHSSMKGMFLLEVLELAASGEPRGAATIVHDAGDHGGRYKALAAELASDGWAIALPSLRGHGGTEGDRGHSAGLLEVVRDLEEIQNHLAYRMPDSPKLLIGQGLGALYSAVFALERPGVVQALVLLNPLHEPRFQEPEAPRGLKKLFNKVTPRSAGSIGWTADDLSQDQAAANDYLADAQTHDVITLRAIDQAREAASSLSRLAQTDIPILIIQSSDDPLSDAARSAALAGGNVDVESVEGRHFPLMGGSAAAVQAKIRAWIDEKIPRA